MRFGAGTGSQRRPAKAPASAQAARTVARLFAPLAKPGPKRYTVPTAQPRQRISPSRERSNQKRILAQKVQSLLPGAKPIGFMGRFGNDLADQALNVPAGLMHTGKAVGLDLKGGLPKALGGEGDPYPKRTVKIAKQVGIQTYRDLQPSQLSKHPGNAAVDILGLLSGGAGAASRLGAAGKAAAEAGSVGDAAKAALVRPGHEGGSLLRRRAPGETELKLNGKTVAHRLEPDSPLLRPVHRVRTKAMQRRLDKPVVETPQHALGKLYAAFSDPHNTIGRELRANAKVDADVAKAPAEALRHEAKKLSRPEHAAMRVVAIEGHHALEHPVEAVQRHIDTHLGWAAEAKTPKLRKLHENVAADLKKALPVLQKPGKRFLSVVDQARALSEQMGEQSVRHKLLTPESAASSRATIAKAYGAPGAKAATREVTRARKGRVEHVREYPGRIVTRERPRTRAEAEQRLTALDAGTQKVIAGLAGHSYDARAEQLARNRTNGLIDLFEKKGQRRGGTSKALRSGRKQSVSDEALAYGAKQLDAFMEKHPSHPVVRAQRARETEANSLREMLNSPEDPWANVAATPSDFGKTSETVAQPGRRVHLAAQTPRKRSVSVNADAVAPEGSFYFPTGDRFQVGSSKASGTPYSPTPGKGGLGPPAAGTHTQGTLKRRTGKALKRGVVEKPAEAIAQAYSGRQKLYSAQDLYRHALRASTEKKTTEFQIPVRNSRAISNELRQRQSVSDLLKRHQGGDEGALQQAIQEIEKSIRVPGHEHADIGASIPGVRWVDHRILKEISTGTPGKVSKAAKAINAPFRTLGVYARPAYVATNKPQNYLMQAILQGAPKAGANLYRANRAGHIYGAESKAAIRSAMGTARSASYAPRGRLSRAERALIQGLSTATDQDSRMAAFLYRAHERGYKGKDGLARLFTDPAAHHDLQMVTRRARKDAVDFDSLTPGEHALSDAVYFYPWMSRATAWAGRTALNRPVKSALLAQQGRVAERSGDTIQAPSWLKGYVKTPAGVVNTGPVGPYSTPGQIFESVAHPGQSSSLAQEFGTPLVQALSTAASKGSYASIPGKLVGGTAPARALTTIGTGPHTTLGHVFKAIGVDPQTLLGKPGKTFPQRGGEAALRNWTLGGLNPRHPDWTQVAKSAKAEERLAMSPVERTRQNLHEKRLEYLYAARKAGLVPKDAAKQPEPVRQAFDLRATRKIAYVTEAQARGKPLTEYDRFMVDQALLLDRKKITVDQANTGIKWAKTAEDREIRSFRHQLGNRFFGGLILEAATRQLNAHGADVRLN